MSTGRTRLEFRTGVARFDAMGNLFVHLPHSTEAPLPVVLGDGTGSEAPARERRALVVGQAGASSARGTFLTTADLPRGSLVVTVQGWDSLVLRDDGALEVEVAEAAELPSWFRAGQSHTFQRGDQPVRLWAKSALPDGVVPSEHAGASGASPTAEPRPEPPREAPAGSNRPAPPPFEPDQARRADGSGRLAGCTGLLALCALGVSVLALLLV